MGFFRKVSIHAAALAVAVQLAWTNLPPELRDSVPPHWAACIAVGVLILSTIGRE